MIKETVTLDETVEYLNELIKLDALAMSDLANFRVPCNLSLADHPTVQVNEVMTGYKKDIPQFAFQVGLMGILNGLFGVNDNNEGNLLFIFSDDNSLKRVVKRE